MALLDFACEQLRIANYPPVDTFFGVIEYFGHVLTGMGIGVSLFLYGRYSGNPVIKRAGLAVTLSFAAAGIASEGLKTVLQMPRPNGTGTGFPSSHTSGAFALASSLSISFPALAPLFYFLAVLTAVSRLYLRSHFVIDVIGGLAIGLLSGALITKQIMRGTELRRFTPALYAGLLVPAVIGGSSLLFFTAYEKSIYSQHMSFEDIHEAEGESYVIEFDSSEGRRYLRGGWSWYEIWKHGNLSVVWAECRISSLILPFRLTSDEHRMRLRIRPFDPHPIECQYVETKFNDVSLGRIHLVNRWATYELEVPGELVRKGENRVDFLFDLCESPENISDSEDTRHLSVAFDKLEIYPLRSRTN